MTFQDIVNFWLNHPPIEVTDMNAYQELVQLVVQETINELSEVYPIIDEAIFRTGYAHTILPKIRIVDPVNTTHRFCTLSTQELQDNGMALVDLHWIDPNLMNIIALYNTADGPPDIINKLAYKYKLSKLFSDNANKKPVFSLLDIIAFKNEIYEIREWFSREIEKIKYKGSKIKLKPQSEYYILYERYRNLDEIPIELLRPFELLLGTNILIQFYNSDIYSGESEIRSVSISGLSVSFNVPSADSKQTMIMRLQDKKNDILSKLSLDYDEDEFALI